MKFEADVRFWDKLNPVSRFLFTVGMYIIDLAMLASGMHKSTSSVEVEEKE